MKITFVLPSFSWRPIGGYRVVYEYANRLAARGHEVTVAHAHRFPNVASPTRISAYQLLRREGANLRNWLFRYSIRWQPLDPRVRLVRIPDPIACNLPDGHAVFATEWPTAEYVAEYPPSKGQKFYLVMDFAPWCGPRNRLEATWRLPLQKVTISGWLYEQVCRAQGAQGNTVNIPIGIDQQRFCLSADIRSRPKRALMFYGHFPYKAPDDGISALEAARQSHRDMSLVVFGPQRRRPTTIPSWASYRANVSERSLIALYNWASIFVCSSLAEGFALPPAEAMACGCAVVSTDCGGIREFAHPEVTALLSPASDPQALARNLIRVLDDNALRVSLAEAGNRRIRQFTWERSTDQLEQFISLPL